MYSTVTASALAMLLAAAGAASACEGNVTLLEDHFDANSHVWSTTGTVTYSDGVIEMKVKPGKADKIFASPIYKDVDICAEMSVTAGSNLPGIYVGVAFWATDKDNLYTFQISPSGVAGVFRLKDGEWSTIVEDTKSDAIKQGREKINTLRVTTEGEDGTIYVNDEEIADFKGEPPTQGQLVGFVAQASDQSSATFQFDDFQMTSPN